MNNWIRRFQSEIHDDFSLTMLRGAIILVALVFMVLALFVKNKWILAGILAYMVLP